MQNMDLKIFTLPLVTKERLLKNILKQKNLGWNINLIETGQKTMTGGRLKRLKDFRKRHFLLTYGDGVSNVNLKKLIKFHQLNNKILTLTAVRPPASDLEPSN